MSVRNTKNNDYDSVKPLSKNGSAGEKVFSSLKPIEKIAEEKALANENLPDSSLISPYAGISSIVSESTNSASATEPIAGGVSKTPADPSLKPGDEKPYSEQQKEAKLEKAAKKDKKLLSNDRWLARNGHYLTYIGVFLFTLVVYFRPYELIPGLAWMTSLALILAVATLLVYLPSQLITEGSITILTTEVKCLLFITFWALLIIPISRDPGLAWETFNDTFIKVVLIFIVMVNTLRTSGRMRGLMFLSVAVGVLLSYQVAYAYFTGNFKIEGYRVETDLGGMFGNPNDTAIHLVMFTPLAVVLGITSRNALMKILYFGSAGFMVVANFLTQSRGGFLGLIVIYLILMWKLSKKNRMNIIIISVVLGMLVLLFAPGNYWVRVLSIFIPGLDPVGSSDQRREILIRSIITTLRNPWGIGMGNFPIVSIRNLVSHNAYTQVSAELGVLCLACYMIFIVSPLRKLAAIERRLFAKRDYSEIYYLSVGLQACIVGYMVTSFFASIAYTWFIYYPIAYAICLRRIYKLQNGESEEPDNALSNYFNTQRA